MASPYEKETVAKNWIKKATEKHPGALTRAARKRGLSTREEASKESHSSNPKIAARGRLGARFIAHKI